MSQVKEKNAKGEKYSKEIKGEKRCNNYSKNDVIQDIKILIKMQLSELSDKVPNKKPGITTNQPSEHQILQCTLLISNNNQISICLLTITSGTKRLLTVGSAPRTNSRLSLTPTIGGPWDLPFMN